MSEYSTTNPEETGLAEELEAFVQYEQASTGQRFINYLVDNLFMQYGLSYLTGMLVGYLLGTFFPEFSIRLSYEESQGDLFLLSYIIVIFNYIFYYTICERAFKGYTLGKLISGTRAIREDGSELRFRDALLRSLSRLVPFEVLSGFGIPWHDRWTKTMVVKSR
jgi:uncharacterized RDD family membrane protein YckC